MSIRLFEGAYNAVAYSQFRPKPPPALIKRLVDYISEKINPPLACAVDVGCGNGQSTSILAPHFKQVFGQDISTSQIEEGIKLEKNNNVSYRVCEAEKLDYPDSSVDLVTACQAAHWFDLPAFYKAADKILKPNGVLALYAYQLPNPVYNGDGNILRDVVMDFYMKDTEGYWNERRIMVDMGYKDIILPYPNYIRDDTSFTQSASSNVEDLVNYMKTWSGFQNFKNQHPEQAEKALENFQKRIMDKLGVNTSPKDTPLTVVFQYFILMARKP